MKKPTKIHMPRPPKPPDRPQNPRTPRFPGKKVWVRAHWRWDYNHQQWEWVLGHWRE